MDVNTSIKDLLSLNKSLGGYSGAGLGRVFVGVKAGAEGLCLAGFTLSL